MRYLLQRLGLPRVLQAFEAEWCGRAQWVFEAHMGATLSLSWVA